MKKQQKKISELTLNATSSVSKHYRITRLNF